MSFSLLVEEVVVSTVDLVSGVVVNSEFIHQVCAHAIISDLQDKEQLSTLGSQKTIIERLALGHGISSSYTSWLAIRETNSTSNNSTWTNTTNHTSPTNHTLTTTQDSEAGIEADSVDGSTEDGVSASTTEHYTVSDSMSAVSGSPRLLSHLVLLVVLLYLGEPFFLSLP
eukprot:TRINITY_DN5411_c0_g1_i2.p1 TRINITY_DN5411_c0_g1~~TRINITY_DN5411_c0_g1_i2.p1  ORF type:complete len:170 (-),score=40.12 TRINITY_DN5411_c0_g1_i2:155-664(-)